MNVVVGIHIAEAGQAWKIGYGFLVGFILVVVVVLEALMRVRKNNESDKHTAFTIGSIEREISL